MEIFPRAITRMQRGKSPCLGKYVDTFEALAKGATESDAVSAEFVLAWDNERDDTEAFFVPELVLRIRCGDRQEG